MSIREELNEIATEIQHMVDEEFKKVSRNERDIRGLDQCGLKNGSDIITEYTESGEFGLAFDHLEYMIAESEINLLDRIHQSFVILKEKFR